MSPQAVVHLSPRYSHEKPVSGCSILTAVIDHNMDAQYQVKYNLFLPWT